MKMRGGAKKMGLFGAVAVFVISALYLLYVNRGRHIILGVGSALILYAASGGELVGSLLAGALIPLLFNYFNPTYEGFEDKKEERKEEKKEETKEEAAPTAAKNPPPDHGERGEFFELGKKYKLPNEKDDPEFHLDAGTTFMNAYKSLKPDQIAAMTKDTQELMETQKQLMSTLNTLKPLMTDGKQMMEMFQSYFGAGNPTPN
jgi:hypothetical protein